MQIDAIQPDVIILFVHHAEWTPHFGRVVFVEHLHPTVPVYKNIFCPPTFDLRS